MSKPAPLGAAARPGGPCGLGLPARTASRPSRTLALAIDARDPRYKEVCVWRLAYM